MANYSSKRLETMPSFSSSVEQIVGNKDILIQILLRLPSSSIVRFKSVSQQWLDLISGTWFSLEHIRRNPKPSICGLFYDEPYNKGACPIPLQSGHSVPTLTFIKEAKVRIIDSINGLVLCSYESSSDGSDQMIIVCNPTTQKYRKISEHPDMTKSSQPYLYFNPSLSHIYKVILIGDENNGLYYNVAIYTSDHLTWKTIRLEGERQWGRVVCRGLLSSDGVIHMSTSNSYHVKFNVVTEQISGALVTYEPERPPRARITEYFGESFDGNLVSIESPSPIFDIMIYEMAKQEGGRWVLKHHLDLMQELNQPINEHTFAIMRVIWDGITEDRDLTFVLAISGEVIAYNLKRKEKKMICDFPGSCTKSSTYLVVHPFTESFNAV